MIIEKRHKAELVQYRRNTERELKNAPIRFQKHIREELRQLSINETRLANSRLFQEARVVQRKIECLVIIVHLSFFLSFGKRKRGTQLHRRQIPKEVSKLVRKFQKKQKLEQDQGSGLAAYGKRSYSFKG